MSSTGCAFGCLRKCRLASSSAWCRLVPLSHIASSAGQLARCPSPAACRPKPISCRRVAAEPRPDQRVQRQRGALHRHPAAVHRHRERRVDQQRDGGLGARLGLAAPRRRRSASRTPSRARSPPSPTVRTHGVGHRAGDVPRLGVAELPLAGGAATARRPRRPGARRAGPGGRDIRVGDVRAAAPCRAGASPSGDSRSWPSRAALEVAACRAAPARARAGCGRRRRPRRRAGGPACRGRRRPAGRRRRTARAARRGRRGRRGPAARRCRRRARAPARRRTAPSRPSPRRAAAHCRLASSWASCCISSGRAERLLRTAASARRAARRSSSCSIRWAAAARWASASISSSTFCGFSGKKSPCLSMKSAKSSSVSSPRPVLVEQLVEVA